MKFNAKKLKISKEKIFQVSAIFLVVLAISVLIFSNIDFDNAIKNKEPSVFEKSLQQETANQSLEANQVIAIVNGENISRSEILDILDILTIQGINMSELEVLQEIISMRLLIGDAKQKGYSISDNEMEDMLRTQLEEQGMTLEDFKKQVETQGQSYDVLLKQNKENALMNKYIEDILKDVEDPAEQQKVVKSLIDDLMKNADIEYLI
jgi:hypothetical protein